MRGLTEVLRPRPTAGDDHGPALAGPLDDAMLALRLIVLAFILLDLVTSVIARAYGVTQVGPTNLAAIAQSLLILVAVAAAMWLRPRLTLVLALFSVVGVFLVGPTGSELYLLAVTAVMTTAAARRSYVVVLVAAQVAYAVGYYFVEGPGDDWVPTLTILAVALVGDGLGLIARRLIAIRDRHRLQVRQTERENAEVRAAERTQLADDLQQLVIRDLDEIEAQISRLDRSNGSAADLRAGLARVRDLSTALLAQLRVLLQVLRRDLAVERTLVGPQIRPHRWLDRLTARDVRIAVSATAGLLVVRAIVVAGSLGFDSDVWVQTLGLLACGFAVWRPRVAVGLASVALVGAVAGSAPSLWDTVPVALLCVIGALWWSRRLWLVVLGLLIYGGLLAATSTADPIQHVVLVVVTGLVAILAGTFARHLVNARTESRRELVRLGVERRRLAFVERSEVARELHDIVAHQLSITSMVVMATGASEDRSELLAAVGRVSRSAQAARRELKVLLSAIRGRAAQLPEPAPLVTPVACARALERQLTEDGFHPVLDVDPAAEHLDSATQRTISRIMQEATTNIVRYAPAGSTAELTLAVRPHETRLRIASPLTSGAVTSDLSLGWGLRGIRERVDLSHGTFAAGPERGRWIVAVTLPDLTRVSLPAAVAG